MLYRKEVKMPYMLTGIKRPTSAAATGKSLFASPTWVELNYHQVYLGGHADTGILIKLAKSESQVCANVSLQPAL